MTLIATHISKYGIVQSSDSNLTYASGKAAGVGKKVFDLSFGVGALAVAGTYSVAGQDMDVWMAKCIEAYGSAASPTIPGFAEHLRARLSRELADEEREDLTLVHIGAYVDGPDGAHPAMFFVRNVSGINPDGSYVVPAMRECELSDDFWARDYPEQAGTRFAMASGGWQSYFNGFAEGRIAWAGLHDSLHAYFQRLWQTPGWNFRPPASLEEIGAFAELELHPMDFLFRSSDYPAPLIGGEPQVRLIAPPPNAIQF